VEENLQSEAKSSWSKLHTWRWFIMVPTSIVVVIALFIVLRIVMLLKPDAFGLPGEKRERTLLSVESDEYLVSAHYNKGLAVTTDAYLHVEFYRLRRWPRDTRRLFTARWIDSVSMVFLDDTRVRILLLDAIPGTYLPTEYRIRDTMVVDLTDPPRPHELERRYDLR
jgi:hypothetical protein